VSIVESSALPLRQFIVPEMETTQAVGPLDLAGLDTLADLDLLFWLTFAVFAAAALRLFCSA